MHKIFIKCKDVCYLTIDSLVLESAIQDAEEIYSRLIKSTDPNNSGKRLPVFLILVKVSVNKCRKRDKFQSKQIHDGPAQK